MPIREFKNKKPDIAKSAYVDDSALIIGDVKIGEDSSIWPMAVLRGDIHAIKIGNRSNIQDGTIIHVTHAGVHNPEGYSVNIADNVIVGHQVVLHGCTIEEECLIGMGVRILDGAIVKKNVIVGAGSLVPPGKMLESGYLWLGTPVKKIRPLTEEEIKYFAYSSNYYVQLKNEYLSLYSINSLDSNK